MPYLGASPKETFTAGQSQTITGTGATSYSLNTAVTTPEDLEVFINNVRQQPTTAYTVSGSTITFDEALLSTDTCYVVFQGQRKESRTHPAASNLQAANITASGNATVTGTSTLTGDVAVATDALKVDGANNRVGIGTTSPDVNLTVFDSAARLKMINASNHQVNFGLWDGSNYRMEGDSNRPLYFTSYNSTGIQMGKDGGVSFRVEGSTGKTIVTPNDTYSPGTLGQLNVIIDPDSAGVLLRSTEHSATGFNATNILHCYNSISSSNVYYDVAYVGHSPNVLIWGSTLESDGGHLGGGRYMSRMYGTYGSVVNTTFAGGSRVTAMNGGAINNFEYRYLNSGASSGSYRLQVRVGWSGSITNMKVMTTVMGNGLDTMYEDN
jgi:hypothetical protein